MAGTERRLAVERRLQVRRTSDEPERWRRALEKIRDGVPWHDAGAWVVCLWCGNFHDETCPYRIASEALAGEGPDD